MIFNRFYLKYESRCEIKDVGLCKLFVNQGLILTSIEKKQKK